MAPIAQPNSSTQNSPRNSTQNFSTQPPTPTDRPRFQLASSKTLERFPMLQAVIEGLMDGLMIVSVQGEIIGTNTQAQQLCYHLKKSTEHHHKQIPDPIWQVCQALIDSQDLFPHQFIIPESEITLDNARKLRIRVRWLLSEDNPIPPSPHHPITPPPHPPYILVTLEDRTTAIDNQAIGDMQKYGLTASELRVWQLRLHGLSYEEIAAKLYITKNTVKKHVKSALAKQRRIGVVG